MKSIKIRNSTMSLEHDLDTPFTIVLMGENKHEKLDPQEVKEGIASMLFNECLNCLDCVKEDIVEYSFKMNDLIGKNVARRKQIKIKKDMFCL